MPLRQTEAVQRALSIPQTRMPSSSRDEINRSTKGQGPRTHSLHSLTHSLTHSFMAPIRPSHPFIAHPVMYSVHPSRCVTHRARHKEIPSSGRSNKRKTIRFSGSVTVASGAGRTANVAPSWPQRFQGVVLFCYFSDEDKRRDETGRDGTRAFHFPHFFSACCAGELKSTRMIRAMRTLCCTVYTVCIGCVVCSVWCTPLMHCRRRH